MFDVYSLVIHTSHDTFATLPHFAHFLYGGLKILESCGSEFHAVRVDITVIASARASSTGDLKRRKEESATQSVFYF